VPYLSEGNNQDRDGDPDSTADFVDAPGEEDLHDAANDSVQERDSDPGPAGLNKNFWVSPPANEEVPGIICTKYHEDQGEYRNVS